MNCNVLQSSGLPVVKPFPQRTGHIVCAFASDAAREHAWRALQACEFDTHDLSLLDAAEMSERLTEEIERYAEDLPNKWREIDAARRLCLATARGSVWLVMPALSDRQVLMAQRVLRENGAQRAIHFGPLWIEDLATRR